MFSNKGQNLRQLGSKAEPVCLRQMVHAPEGRRAQETPPTRSPVEVRAACLTLRQPGPEAEPARIRQPIPEARAMRRKDVGPTRHPRPGVPRR
ncbi:hypothetical protein MRB53_034451 [Persea americana]|uniref:Uncharacterized protein n=1 Tax=Persea americana TaxID=3435 RepID=A0ACC2K1X9_PERAE|nr:hypothetical protein MRB53_034451 [Persea americana]